MITLFGLWMHTKNTALAKLGVRTMDIIVDTEKIPSVTMIHRSEKYKGMIHFNSARELEFELFNNETDELLKWSMQSNVNPSDTAQLEEMLQPYFRALQTGMIETFDSFLKYA